MKMIHIDHFYIPKKSKKREHFDAESKYSKTCIFGKEIVED